MTDTPTPAAVYATPERVAEMEATIVRLRDQLDITTDQLRRAREMFNDFKEAVIDEAENIREEQDWCYDGMVQHLDNLGLEPRPRLYSGSFLVRVQFEDLRVNPDESVGDRVQYAMDELGWSGDGVGEVTGIDIEGGIEWNEQ